MWSYAMASGWENATDRSMKAMSWKVVDVVVFAIGGDARDVVTVGIESDLMGIVYSCDIRNGGNESMTISIISIIITIVANNITVMMTTPRHQRDIGTRETEVRRAVSSAVAYVVGMLIVCGGKDVVMKVNSADERVVIRVGHTRRKMGSERVLTITRGWSNTDVDVWSNTDVISWKLA